MNENDEEIAQRFLAVHKIQSGYRHILLRNKYNQSEGPASVFVRIKSSIYVPSYQLKLRDRYVDPLREKNQRENERKNFENPFNMSGKSQKKQSTE
ncbi:hypothetical protein M3Y95_00661400 [Aphelenchoides besseyi]|nr:hypothetical protein M3Y95_00661400 [Aphelenchoides besseyi]